MEGRREAPDGGGGGTLVARGDRDVLPILNNPYLVLSVLDLATLPNTLHCHEKIDFSAN
jgi:hypothetical protein